MLRRSITDSGSKRFTVNTCTVTIIDIIVHCSHYLSSHLLRAYSSFWKLAHPTDLLFTNLLDLLADK